jgi:hypothetical protein
LTQRKEDGYVISAPEPGLLRVLKQAQNSVLEPELPQVREQVLPPALLPLLVLVPSSEPRPQSVSAC